MSVDISKIRTDGGTQSRAEIRGETVEEYAEAMADPNVVFPPIVVYFDGSDYWLADGFHRLEAWRRIGRHDIPVDLRQGDRRKAILHSVIANSTHGLRRTNADKRRAVMVLLEDDEWSQWNNHEIARHCAVSSEFVRQVRNVSLATVASENPASADESGGEADVALRTYTTRHGTQATMNVAKIGKARAKVETETKQLPSSLDLVSAPNQETPSPPDPHRKGLSSLTREGLEDEAAGLRAENEALRAKLRSARAEADDLKAQLKVFTAADDMGRKLGQIMRERDKINGRLQEVLADLARTKRRALHLEEELAQAKKSLESQVIAL